MRKILLLLVSALCCILAKADNMLLQIWLSDGQVMSINLNEEPTTTYVDGNLVITTTKATVTFPLETVNKFTYYMPTNGIDTTEGLGTKLSQDGESLTFYGLNKNTEITVYSPAGVTVRKVKSGSEKSTTVTVSDLPSGAYIVKVNSITYKITKL